MKEHIPSHIGELRAAVAVALLGWTQCDPPDVWITPGDAVWISPRGDEDLDPLGIVRAVEQDHRDRHGESHPGGWLGIVDDAMIARGLSPDITHTTRGINAGDKPRWAIAYGPPHGNDQWYPDRIYVHADRERATLGAALVALHAQAIGDSDE